MNQQQLDKRREARFRRLTKEQLQNKYWRGCADPGEGGCIGSRCDSCLAKQILKERGGVLS